MHIDAQLTIVNLQQESCWFESSLGCSCVQFGHSLCLCRFHLGTPVPPTVQMQTFRTKETYRWIWRGILSQESSCSTV